jgi:hypothetical protein
MTEYKNKEHSPVVSKEESFNPYDVKMCAQASIFNAEYYYEGYDDASKRKMRAAFLKSKVWPSNTTIKIGFLSVPSNRVKRTKLWMMKKQVDIDGVSLPIDPLQESIDELTIIDAVIKVVQERLQPIVNLKFKFYDDNNNLINPNVADIRIDFDSTNGAWSLLGTECLQERDKTKATMNLGWFDVATTLHEFCHALGMIHEHQNPKGNKIKWNVKRVQEWANKTQGWDLETTNLNIIERYKSNEINGSTFDPLSIMLYFFPSSVVDDENGECCGNGTSQNLMFSPFDVLYLNYTYPLTKTSLTPVQFTVKYFNDNFNKQVDPEDLERQLNNIPFNDDNKNKNLTTSNNLIVNEDSKKPEKIEEGEKTHIDFKIMMNQLQEFINKKLKKIDFVTILFIVFIVFYFKNIVIQTFEKLNDNIGYVFILIVILYIMKQEFEKRR